MIDFKVDLDDREAKKLFRQIRTEMPTIGKRMLGKVSSEIKKDVKRNYLSGQVLKKKTGNLQKGLRYKVFKDFSGYVENVAPHAHLHENGAMLLPKTAEYLVFPVDDGSFRKVKSAVLPARPYLKPAMEDMFSSGRAQNLMEDIMQIALKEIEHAH